MDARFSPVVLAILREFTSALKDEPDIAGDRSLRLPAPLFTLSGHGPGRNLAAQQAPAVFYGVLSFKSGWGSAQPDSEAPRTPCRFRNLDSAGLSSLSAEVGATLRATGRENRARD